MKKIIFLWQQLSLGGGEIAMLNLSRLLAKKQYLTDLFLLENINDFNNEKIKHFNNIKTYTNIINMYKIIIKYDFIIINDEAKLSLISIPLKFIYKGKIIFWSHLNKDFYTKQLIKNKYHIYINKFALKFIANNIICVSNYATLKMTEYLNTSNKVSFIYNVPSYKKTIINNSNNNKYFKVLSVGRLSHEKNFEILIKAIIHLHNKYPIELTICGNGGEREKLQNIININNANQYIKLVGIVYNTSNYYNQADLFISSSLTESFSMVVVEALHHKIPVIATNTGAAEILEDNTYGITIPINDLNTMIKAIDNLITDKILYKYYKDNGSKALNKFHPDKIYKQWLTILQ
jgi:glycosyltransferase involved in cell wall biosynthesis